MEAKESPCFHRPNPLPAREPSVIVPSIHETVSFLQFGNNTLQCFPVHEISVVKIPNVKKTVPGWQTPQPSPIRHLLIG